MNSKLKSIIFYIATIGIAVFLVWFSFKDLDPKDPVTGESISKTQFLLLELQQANLFFLLLSGVFAIASHLVRAERWKILMEPLGEKITLKQGFIAVMIGYFINLVIPRGGEVSRSVTLSKMNRKVKIDSCLGTIVAERVIDLFFLLFFIGVAFLIEFDSLSDFIKTEIENGSKNGQETSYLKWYIMGGLAVLGVAAYFLITKLALFEGIRQKGIAFLVGLKQGLTTVLKLKKVRSFVFYSMSIWILYYLMCYAVFLAFPSTAKLGPLAALSIFAIGGIAMAIPMPGGTGTYHYLVPSGFIFLYGAGSKYITELLTSDPTFTEKDIISKSEATAFATIFHGWQTLVIIVVGAICMGISNKIIKKQREAEISGKNTTT